MSIFLIYSIKTVSAEVIFSEIMYNPEGIDAGYEWIEIYNNTNKDINLEKWRFCEDTNYHYLRSFTKMYLLF